MSMLCVECVQKVTRLECQLFDSHVYEQQTAIIQYIAFRACDFQHADFYYVYTLDYITHKIPPIYTHNIIYIHTYCNYTKHLVPTLSGQRSPLRILVHTVVDSSPPFPLLKLLSHLTLCYTMLCLLSHPAQQYTVLHRIRESLLGIKDHRSTTRLSTSPVDRKVQGRLKRQEKEFLSRHLHPDIVAPH